MVPVTAEEKRLPYFKYYEQDMAEIPAEKLAIWRGPAADSSLATPFAERDRFLDDAPPALEAGFCVAPDGTGFVSNTTFLPGVTAEMFYWWFAWHCVGPDLRYKIWDRDDHYHARALTPGYVLDPAVPMAEKTWGVDHDILEDIGFGPDPLVLSFLKPSDFGYSMEKVGGPGCAALVCAVGRSTTPAAMTHKITETEGGSWLRSHFWMGYGFRDGILTKLVPDGESVPEIVPRTLFGHCIKEFSQLAKILPPLYAEEGGRL